MSKELTIVEKNRKALLKRALAYAGLALIVIIAVFLIVSAVNKANEQKYLESYNQTALYVGPYEVDFGLYRCYYLNYRDELKREFTKDGVTDTVALDREIRARIAQDVRYSHAVISLAADYGYSVTSPDVVAVADTYVAEMKAYCTEEEVSFEKMLFGGYMTEEIFTDMQRELALRDVLFRALVLEDGEIENDDAKLREIFYGEGMVRVMSVFIENDEGESKEENLAIANEVIEKYNGGVPFVTLVSQYSEDPYNDFYFTRGEKIEEYERAAFDLEVGEISDVVVTEDGYYVLYRVEKDEAYIEENFESLKSQYQYVRFNEKLEGRMNTLTVSESDMLKGLSYEEIK